MNFCFFFNNEYTIIIILHLFFAFPKKLESKDYNGKILSRESKQRENPSFSWRTAVKVIVFSANTARFTWIKQSRRKHYSAIQLHFDVQFHVTLHR